MTRAFVDTNVAVYVFDDDEPDKQAIARNLFDSDAARDFVVSTQVLGEFFVTVTQKFGLAGRKLDDAVALLLAFPVHPVDRATVTEAIDTVRRHQLSYWDALIVEAAVASGCERILTEDLTDGQTIRGVEIVNPFRTESTS